MAGPTHQIWGRPELDSSEGSDSQSWSRERSAEEVRKVILAKLQDVTLNSDSSDIVEQSRPGKASQQMAVLQAEEVFQTAVTTLSNSSDRRSKLQQVQDEDDEEDDGDDNDSEPQIGTWSAGAQLHPQGQCRPCHYYGTKIGCQNGASCSFCHLDHPKRFRLRPCKSKRSKCKKLAGILNSTLLNEDPATFDAQLHKLTAQGGYLKSVVQSKARNLKHSQEVPDEPKVLKPGLLSL